jgi:transposase
VVIEATGNAAAVVDVLSPYVDRVVIANPKQVRMIAHAKVKTDAIDAVVLAKLYASGFLPEVWVPDQRTLALRRQVTRRFQLVRQRVRLKNLIQSILHAHLVPPCPPGNLVGISGRKWLAGQILPSDEREAIERHLSLIDPVEYALTRVDADIAKYAMTDRMIRCLMTLPGVDVTVSSGVAAAIGDISRFGDPQKLVGYLGLNPSVRQSGEGPA